MLDIIALEDRTQTICADQTSEELAVTYTSQNGTGAASYQWYSNTTNTTGTTNPIAGATASSFTPATADLTPNATTFFFVGITLDGCNEKASQVFTVELAPEISFTTQPETSQEVCEGGLATTPLSVTIQGAGTNGATYQWYQNSIGTTNGTVTEIISGATSNTYTPDFTGIAIDVQTNYYYYAIVTTTQGCTLTSAIATVVVSPALAATINPNTEQTVCENEEVILNVTVANGQGTASYQWYEAQDGAVANAINATFTAPTDIAGTKAYYAIVTYDQGPCTTITSETVSIVVTQTPAIADGAVTSYTGTAFTYDPTTETSNTIPTGTTYTWTVSNPGNITGASAVTTPENVISQTLTNTGTTDVTVNYTVTPTLNGCQGATFQVAVTVTAPMDVTAIITNATCFEDGTFLGNGAIEISITGGVAPYTVSWTAGNGYSNNTEDIIDLRAGDYTLIVTDSANNNNEFSDTYTITQPTINPIDPANNTQTICFGDDAAPLEVTYKDGILTPTYAWYTNTNGSNDPLTSNAIANTNNTSYTPTNNTVIGNNYFFATINFVGCSTAKSSAVFTVNVLEEIKILAQPITTQQLCQGTQADALEVSATGAITGGNLTYQWYYYINGVPANATPVTTAQGTGGTTRSFTPLTDVTGNFSYYVEISREDSNGLRCSVQSETAYLDIDAMPTFISQPVGFEVCLGGTANTLTIDIDYVGTPNYQWYIADGSPNGSPISIADGGTDLAYTPEINAIGTTAYYVEVSFTSGGCNAITSDTVDVTVGAAATITPEATSQTICLGGTLAPLTVSYTDGLGAPSYQWYEAVDATTNTGGLLIPGATSSQFTPIISEDNKTFYYYVAIALDSNDCSPGNSGVYTVIVNEGLTIEENLLAFQAVCATADTLQAPVLNITVEGEQDPSIYTYKWYTNTFKSELGAIEIADNGNNGATTASFTPDISVIGTNYYYVVVSENTIACAVTSGFAQVDVTPELEIIDDLPATIAACLGEVLPTLEATHTGTGTANYQWYKDGVVILNYDMPTYTPLADNAGTTSYAVRISYTDSNCGSILSDTTVITVIAPATIIPETTYSQVICEGGTATLNVTLDTAVVTNPPTIFQWYRLINGIEEEIPDANDASFTTAILSEASIPYQYFVRVGFGDTTCESSDSSIYEVVVSKVPEILVAPQDVAICADRDITSTDPTITKPELTVVMNTTAANTSAFLYEWYEVGNGLVGEEPSLPITKVTPGIYEYYVIVSQPEAGCSTTSAIATINIYATPTINEQPEGNQEVCKDGTAAPLTVVISNSLESNPFYQWYETTINGTNKQFIPVINGNGANTASFNPPTDTPGDRYYYVEITFKDASDTDIGCTMRTSDIAQVTTVALPQATPITMGSSGPEETTICSGGFVEDLTAGYVGGSGTASYQWYTNITGTKTGDVAEIIPGAEEATYSTGKIDAGGKHYYYARILLDGNGCTSAMFSDPFEVTVIDDPTVIQGGTFAPLLNQDVCEGGSIAPLEVTVTSSDPTSLITYQWYSNTTASVFNGTAILDKITDGVSNGATSASFTPDNTVVGTLYYYAITSQELTGCEGISTISRIIVSPKPVIITQPNSYEVCDESEDQFELAVAVDAVPALGAPAYQWYSNTTGIIPVDTSVDKIDTNGDTSNYIPGPSTFDTTTYYYVEITFPAGCETLTSDVVSISPNRGVPYIDTPSSMTYANFGIYSVNEEISFTDDSAYKYGTSVTWSFGDGSEDKVVTYSSSTPTLEERTVTHIYARTSENELENPIGYFKVSLTVDFESGCFETATFDLEITEGYKIKEPNAFTPNGDNINDKIKPLHTGLIEIEMGIYDAWGNRIYFETLNVDVTDSNKFLTGWDGTINGSPAQSGNYLMVVKGTTTAGKVISRNAPITLLR